MRILKILILIPIFFSCVSLKVPDNRKRASRKVEEHLEALRRIDRIHPGLIDSTNTTNIQTITFPKYIVETQFRSNRLNDMSIDSLMFQFLNYKKSIPKNTGNRSIDDFKLQKELDSLRNQLYKAICPDTTFVYEDSLTLITLIKKGVLYDLKVDQKERSQQVQVTQTTITARVIKSNTLLISLIVVIVILVLIIILEK